MKEGLTLAALAIVGAVAAIVLDGDSQPAGIQVIRERIGGTSSFDSTSASELANDTDLVSGDGSEDNPFQSIFDEAVEEETGVEVEDDLEASGGTVSTIEENFTI